MLVIPVRRLAINGLGVIWLRADPEESTEGSGSGPTKTYTKCKKK